MTGRLIGSITRALQKRESREERPPPPPPPALERIHGLLRTRLVTKTQAAAALGVPESELWEWLFGWRWEPTMQTRRDIHTWADRLLAGDASAKGIGRLK